MTKDDIIALPNPHLREKSKRVGLITDEIKGIIKDMEDATISWDLSRAHEVGVALAAVQIDRLYKIVIVRNDYNDKENHEFTVFINPEIVKREGELKADFEGCLSVPNVYGKVPRHQKVKVKALNLAGKEFRVTAEGFLARIFQHEIDHCNGTVFIDHIKDEPEAFFQLDEAGKLQPLDYEEDVEKKILFFGNERLATGVTTEAPALRGLIAAGYEVAAVVVAQNDTGPSRAARRLEVAEVAAEHDIPLLAPPDLRAARDELGAFGAQAAVLIAYGKIVPPEVLELFPAGIVNIHPSLLPLHRGSTPLEAAILDGAAETGVSLMRLAKKMDAGPVYARQVVPLDGTETKQALADRLAAIGTEMLLERLPAILDSSAQPTPQDEAAATYDAHITKTDGAIDWSKPAPRLAREVRAYAGWPRSRATISGNDVIITAARAHDGAGGQPGAILTEDKQLSVSCGEGLLVIDSLIPAGKREMSASAFLAGYSL